jgi:hypothetical protein
MLAAYRPLVIAVLEQVEQVITLTVCCTVPKEHFQKHDTGCDSPPYPLLHRKAYTLVPSALELLQQ